MTTNLVSIFRFTEEEIKKLPNDEWMFCCAYIRKVEGINNNVCASDRKIIGLGTNNILTAKVALSDIEIALEKILMKDPF